MNEKFIVGRVALSDSKGRIETTSWNQTRNNLKRVIRRFKSILGYSTNGLRYETY